MTQPSTPKSDEPKTSPDDGEAGDPVELESQHNDDDLVFLAQCVLPGHGVFDAGDIVPTNIDPRQTAFLSDHSLTKRYGDIVAEADKRSEQAAPKSSPESSGDNSTDDPAKPAKRRRRTAAKTLLE